ncbi:hypothetical protein ANRL2_03635 [Anaerolineae bacterium]|nr:hypothetical protein ANRL2_03635 [Anaerolineae bacterium]
MKRLLILLVLASFMAPLATAQEEPIPPKRSRMAKMGLFGGFTPGYLFMDVKPINSFLAAGKGAALSEGGIFMTGGAGAAYIMVLQNVRLGGMGLSGGLKSSSLELSGLRRDAELSVGMGALTVEYVIPLAPRLDLAFGATIGWGFMDLTLRQSTGGSNTWLGEQQILGGTSGTMVPPNATRILNGSFLLWAPTVNVEYAMLSWLAVRVGATYSMMSFPSWRVDGKYDLLGVPTDVTGKGFMVQGGLLLGTF